VPNNVKVILFFVLLLSACGTTAADVTVGAAPSTSATTIPELTAEVSNHVNAAQAKVAQSVLRNALVAAKTYMTDDGTFNGASPAKLHEIDPYLTFVDADTPVASGRTVSVAIVGDRFAAAALSENGVCYWITENVGVSRTQYGKGTPCTGTGALAATDSSWNVTD
jgi:hypothetical protein